MAKLKFLILLVAIYSVAGFRSKFVNEDAENIQKLRVRQIIHEAKARQEKVAQTGNVLNDFPVQEFNDINFRLPNNTVPVHYELNIELNTSIHTGSLQFEGVVRINISVEEASNTITLQSRGHTISQITLFNADGSVFEANPTSSSDNVTEFLTITTLNQLPVAQLVVEISYASILSTFLDRGFFSVEYRDENNDTAWLATTQFQPINARHAFPCYDEIRYRNTISLRIRHHNSFNAISNMPVEAIVADGDFLTTVFETTPVIPTFLLSFTVSSFNFVSTTDNDLEFRVYARPEAVDAGEADNALELGVTFLRNIEDYFNVSYSFPKSDQIAVPEFSSDGANNWGLLSFHEPILLQQNNDAFAQHIREIRSAHEYSVSLLKTQV